MSRIAIAFVVTTALWVLISFFLWRWGSRARGRELLLLDEVWTWDKCDEHCAEDCEYHS